MRILVMLLLDTLPMLGNVSKKKLTASVTVTNEYLIRTV